MNRGGFGRTPNGWLSDRGSTGADPEGADHGTGEALDRTWPRVIGLFLIVLTFSVAEPAVLVGLPYLLLVAAFPARRLVALLAAVFAVFFVLAPGARQGFWFVERAWALLVGGWFVGLTFRWPERAFSARALGAVAGSGVVAAFWSVVRPGSWSVVDWFISERIHRGVSTALQAVQVLQGEEGVSSGLVTTVYQAADAQANVFPAMLGLASMAALGVAWWLYVRLAHGDGDGLGPAREFRFNDQLIWLLISGILLLVVGSGEGWSRAGSNAVVFMGALYALRGAAVVLFFYGGLSVLGAVLLVLSLILVAPIILGCAVVIGLGDTWLDLRTRARRLSTHGET